jgi:hypothetical protein
MRLEMRSPRGDVATSPAIVAAVTVALGTLDPVIEPAVAPHPISSWRAAGRIYEAYDSRISAERRP